MTEVRIEEVTVQDTTGQLLSAYSTKHTKERLNSSKPLLISTPMVASEFKPTWRFYLAFISIMAVALAAALDATSLSVALPDIARKLGGSAIEAFWSGTSFLLTSTIFQLNFASFSHIFGRRNMVRVDSHTPLPRG
jgi:hypothetical protein